MPRKPTITLVTSKFRTADPAERRAALTRQMARWINGAEGRKGCGNAQAPAAEERG